MPGDPSRANHNTYLERMDMNPSKTGSYYVWDLVSGLSFKAKWDGTQWLIPSDFQDKVYDPIIDHWIEM